MKVTFDTLFAIEYEGITTYYHDVECWAARYDELWLKFTQDQWAPGIWCGMEGQVIIVEIPTWKKRFEILAVDFHELKLYIKELK